MASRAPITEAVPGYDAAVAAAVVVRTRWVLALGIVLYLGFNGLDRILYPANAGAFLEIRAAVSAGLAACLPLTFVRSVQRRVLWLCDAIIVAAAAGICAMIRLTDGAASSYYQGLNLVLLAMFTMNTFRVAHALVTGVAVLLLYLWAVSGEPLAAHAAQLTQAYFFMGSTLAFVLLMTRLYRDQHGREHRSRLALEANAEALAEANRRLTEADRLKDEFLANVSHELRTPLTLIQAPAEKLAAAGNLDDGQRRDVAVMLRNARTLLGHVNDLLDVAKLQAGRMSLERARVDLAERVRRVAANFDGLANERHLAYAVDAPDRLAADVDPPKLDRVLLNLLGNAFKFTPPGGRVRVSLRADEDHVVLEVGDSGPGIPSAQRERVFERFAQVEGGTTRSYGGTGLGLAIARDFVELHGGRIRAADAPEGGALLSVRLPRFAPPGAAVAPEPVAADRLVDVLRPSGAARPELGPEGAPLVLVVEDNADMRRYLRDALGDEFRTAGAGDGREGLAVAMALRPDLILTDVMMPDMSGVELLHALRADPSLAEVPVIVLTAKADDELRARLLREGAQDHLTKPFAVDELRARVRIHVALERARAVLRDELASRSRDVEALARELAERTRAVEAALEAARASREQAERASRAKSDFMNLVSHELRTPLQSLHLQTELLAVDPATNEAQRAIVARLRAATVRLTEMVDGLLEYARLEHGALKVQAAPFDLRALVAEVLTEARVHADPKGLALDCESPPDLPPLTSDRRLVRLVVLNLVMNAVKFTERGGVTVRLASAADAHSIAVADTGPGIAPELAARVFEPFVQGEPTRQKHLRGVGLGLKLVKEITAHLGGRVDLDSAPGRGATFTVTLPPSPTSRS
jgi:signal transduction histidine kinase